MSEANLNLGDALEASTFYLVFEGDRNADGELVGFHPTSLRLTRPERRPEDGAIMEVEATFSEVALVLDDEKLTQEPPPLLRGAFLGNRPSW